ncbi:metallophosphoesterase family protein [Rhodospirillum sp. A1_3_36]|uniref:metallophosphoesterase family protein n=1 Tax=Rhodospirillum sp. A1_3_36 TaxID=3391666 RepID=UPI0039A5FAA6
MTRPMTRPVTRPMTRIAHLSDLHFGRVDDRAVGALVEDLRALAPDLVVVSGDLTQRARRKQFREARAFLDSLERPLLVVPGNHDVPWHILPGRFLGPHGRFRRIISPDTRPIYREGDLIVAGLPTSRAAVAHWNWSLGRISTSGAQRVAQAFHHHSEAGLRILVTHHPLVPMEGVGHRHVAFNAKRALAILGAARVDVLLAGHVHRSQSGCVTLPGGAQGDWHCVTAQAASAVSTRLRGEPNGYNLIEVEGTSMAVQTRIWEPGEAAFREGEVKRYRRGNGGWG